MRRLLAPLAVCSLFTLAACADTTTPLAPPSSPKPLASKTPVEPFGPWGRIVEGETGPGSLYGIYVPTNWNGDVIYFIHGILSPAAPVVLPTDPTIWDGFTLVRDQFGALGFAVAYSSFSETASRSRTPRSARISSAASSHPCYEDSRSGASSSAIPWEPRRRCS